MQRKFKRRDKEKDWVQWQRETKKKEFKAPEVECTCIDERLCNWCWAQNKNKKELDQIIKNSTIGDIR